MLLGRYMRCVLRSPTWSSANGRSAMNVFSRGKSSLAKAIAIDNNVLEHANLQSKPAVSDMGAIKKTEKVLSLKQIKSNIYDEIREFRRRKSEYTSKPLYLILKNAAVQNISWNLPKNKHELLALKGIGATTVQLYGDEIMSIVNKYYSEDNYHLYPEQKPIETVVVPTKNSDDDKVLKQITAKQKKLEKLRSLKKPPVPADAISGDIAVSSGNLKLSVEQQLVFERVVNNRQHICISGSAGTGKTYVLKFLIQALAKREGEGLSITASTGIAAVNIGGCTLHSFAGIGVAPMLTLEDKQKILLKVLRSKDAVERWLTTTVLIIDEISMVSADLLELLDMIAREVKGEKEKPFGGIQLILAGDFHQLPPIFKSHGKSPRSYCFTSPLWAELSLNSKDNTILLTSVHRQKDPKFIHILNEFRIGEVSAGSIKVLNECLISRKPVPNDAIIPTRLYCTNKDVDEENKQRLDALPDEFVVLEAQDAWKVSPTKTASTNVIKSSIDKTVPATIELKMGAQVILTRNFLHHFGLYNGSRGIVVGFDEFNRNPIVTFDTGRVVTIEPVDFEQKSVNNDGVLIRRQIPLKLAWAMTVHKSQGCTLSRAELMLSNAFDHGQVYVALSRVSSLEGLWLTKPINSKSVTVDPLVRQFYQTLEESTL